MPTKSEELPELLDFDTLASRIVPVSRATLWRWENDRDFPKRIRIGGRNFWRKSEVIAWADLQAANDGRQSND